MGPKGIEAWSLSYGKTIQKDPGKVFDKFESSFQTHKMQWSYREETNILKQYKTRWWNN